MQCSVPATQSACTLGFCLCSLWVWQVARVRAGNLVLVSACGRRSMHTVLWLCVTCSETTELLPDAFSH